MQDENTEPLADSELLNLSRGGDTAAFGVLWERHRLAGIVAARNIAPALDADDLVSSSYLKIFELIRDGKGPTGAFRPYLYKVISTTAADAYRSPEQASADLAAVPDLTEAGPWEDGAFDLNAAARAFKSLPDRWQSVLWYSEVEGLAPRQIAPILGLSANGVSALVARATEGLQSAWVEAHINMQLADEACSTTRNNLQRFQLGKLTARLSREVESHLETCDDCAAAAAEFRILNKQLALVLATILLGGVPAAALLGSLGVTAGAAGASAGAAALAMPNAAGLSSASSGGSAAATASVATASATAVAGTSAGIGAGAIALMTTAAIAVAAVGGFAIANTIISAPAVSVSSESLQVDPATEAADPSTQKDAQESAGLVESDGSDGSDLSDGSSVDSGSAQAVSSDAPLLTTSRDLTHEVIPTATKRPAPTGPSTQPPVPAQPLPKDDEQLPEDDTPAPDGDAPAEEGSVPPKDDAPAEEGSVPPKDDAAPPKDDAAPPKDDTAPPEDDTPLDPVIPVLIPPVAPAEVTAGYQCYVPHVDTGQFELRGRGSLPALIQLVLRSDTDAIGLVYSASADGSWSTGPITGQLSDLRGFVDGTVTAEVRLISESGSSVGESVSVNQCADSGPTVDTSLQVADVCVLNPAIVSPHGSVSEYGVLFARKVDGSVVTPIADPDLDGIQDPVDPTINWSGIFTGADPGKSAPNDWFTMLDLNSYFGTVAEYNAGSTGRFELRVQTPDGRTSTWIHVNQLGDWTSCPY